MSNLNITVTHTLDPMTLAVLTGLLNASSAVPAGSPVVAPVSAATPATPPTPVATAPTAAPAVPVAPVVPVASPPEYSVAQLQQACAPLMDAGKQQQIVSLIQSFGAQALTQVPQERLGEFATALRGLGAQI